MNSTTLELVQQHFTLRPEKSASRPAGDDDIKELEFKLGWQLPDDYKQFLRKFGAGIVGPYAIYGIGVAPRMGAYTGSAWDETVNYKKQKWEGVENWLVVSMDHSGNPVGIDRNGVVWISDHDFGGVAKLFDTFEQYLRHTCLNVN